MIWRMKMGLGGFVNCLKMRASLRDKEMEDDVGQMLLDVRRQRGIKDS